MGTICKVGETKNINGKLYRKCAEADEVCTGCAFARTRGPEQCPSEDGRSMIHQVRTSLEDGGCECHRTIWKRVEGPAPKVTKKCVWTTRTLEITDRIPKTTLRALILEGLDEINQLGTENAKLRNQIASLKKKGAK